MAKRKNFPILGVVVAISIFSLFFIGYYFSYSGESTLLQKGKQVECDIKIDTASLSGLGMRADIESVVCDSVGSCTQFKPFSIFSTEGKLQMLSKNQIVSSQDYKELKLNVYDSNYFLEGCVDNDVQTVIIRAKDEEGVADSKEVAI